MMPVSLESVRQGLFSALRRFPLVVLAGLIGAAAIGILNHSDSEAVKESAGRVSFSMAFAFPLLVAAVYAGELFLRRRWIFQAFAVLGIWAHWQFLDPKQEGLTMLVVWIAAASIASTIPGLVTEPQKNWWRVNFGALNAIVLASILNLIVLAGLMVALESIRSLFHLKLPRLDGDLVGFCGFLFWPLATTALLPPARAVLDANQPGFAVWGRLCQWALVPMGFLFTGILAAYAGRILIERAMPDGMVALPVLALGSYGLVAVWISEPWRDERKWTRSFTRIFPVAFPLFSILLFLALSRRINDYGFTSERYAALALAVWITVCCLISLVRRSAPPTIATALLAVFALLATFGPLSARQVCLRSQMGRLEKLLADRSAENDNLIASSLSYIALNYDQAMVEKITGPLDLEKGASKYDVNKAAKKKMGLPEVGYDGSVRVNFQWPDKKPVSVEGYRLLHSRDGGFVLLGTNDDPQIGIHAEQVVARSGGKTLHVFDLSGINPTTAEAADAPPSFEWKYGNREFLVILLSASWRGSGKAARLVSAKTLVLEK